MNTNIFTKIIETLIGRKYYVNIVGWKGTDKFEATSFIWSSRSDAMKHKASIENTLSFQYIETVTFRSHKIY